MWYHVIVISVGGILGVNARYWLGVLINRWTGPQFPWATLMINVTGSFAIGLLTVSLAHWLPHPYARLLVTVGFLGGYTNFSSFSLESLTLWERGEHGLCAAYMAASVAGGFAAVVLGTALGRGLTQPAVGRAAPSDPPASAAGARAQITPGWPVPASKTGSAAPDHPAPGSSLFITDANEPVG
jgi:CrcB protein